MGSIAFRRISAGVSAAALVMALAACSGGGGRSGGPSAQLPTPPPPAPAPTPPPPPPAPPPPPPSSTNFDTAEYRRSDGPSFHHAITAYQAGATGQGVTIGVLDTGIDPDSHEFAGRIAAASRDVAGNRELADEDGHGSAVSRVLAGAKDDLDIHGIAFDATILTLRADTPGSCAAIPGEGDEAGCSFNDSSIATGVDVARKAGARVLNISLGGPNRIGTALANAIGQATRAGLIIIVSAGNEFGKDEPDYDPDNPSPFAQSILEAGGGNVIIATAVDDGGIISDFSDRAGASRAAVLSALGNAICCVYENDRIKTTMRGGQQFVTVFNGTSFSAPQISGAAALLAQAFPNLTGAQIVEILLRSARDAGATGTDSVYGRGILDIAAAFDPQGATSLAGSTTFVALGESAGTTSGAMGDAGLAQAALSAVLLDSYDRAYTTDLGYGLTGSAPSYKLTGALTDRSRSVSLGAGPVAVAFSIAPMADGTARVGELRLRERDGEGARLIAGRIAARLSPDASVSFGIAQGASGQVAALQGSERPAFLVGEEARGSNGFIARAGASAAVRRRLGDYGLTISGESGDAALWQDAEPGNLSGRYHDYGYARFGAALDRRFGDVTATLGADWLREDETVLGARFSEALGRGGASSVFIDAGLAWEPATGWQLAAGWRQGWTRALATQTVTGTGVLQSSAFNADLSKRNIFGGDDELALRFAQPLRVSDGGIDLNLPVAYDYASGDVTFGTQRLNLAPQGRELVSEMSYRASLWEGIVSANLFWRRQPGHYQAAPDDMGAALRYSLRF
ncbi:S8 family peptidase [Novosphingopyxis sp.]|uniref:S8 family peptidase n=1 Tax=Novosphingopyxis sp. TaxID=2709690 RepID=UPI003B58BD28